MRKILKGKIIAASGSDLKDAEDNLQNGDAVLVAFGHLFTWNPDLPERFRLNLPLTPD